MTKNKRTSSESGNAKSVDSPGPARPWTDEEMAAAKPLPLPTINPPEKTGTSGVAHAGKGGTKPAGRPEDNGRRQAK
jgi:hypothetical protein